MAREKPGGAAADRSRRAAAGMDLPGSESGRAASNDRGSCLPGEPEPIGRARQRLDNARHGAYCTFVSLSSGDGRRPGRTGWECAAGAGRAARDAERQADCLKSVFTPIPRHRGREIQTCGVATPENSQDCREVLTAKWVRSIFTTGGQVGQMARNTGFMPVFHAKMPAKLADFPRRRPT